MQQLLFNTTYTYHMAKRVASVAAGTAADEFLLHKTRFKIRNVPKTNLKLDERKHQPIEGIFYFSLLHFFRKAQQFFRISSSIQVMLLRGSGLQKC